MSVEVITLAALVLAGFAGGTAFGYAVRSYLSRRRRGRRSHLVDQAFTLAPPARDEYASGEGRLAEVRLKGKS